MIASGGVVYNGVGWDRWLEISGSNAQPATGIPAVAVRMWNGSTWDQLVNARNDGSSATGILAVHSHVYNGATFDRMREAPSDGAARTGILAVHALLYNGATFDQPREIATADGFLPVGIPVVAQRILNAAGTYDNVRGTNSPGVTAGHPAIGQARLITYGAVGRLTTRPYFLSHVFAGAGRFQYLTIYHGAGSTKNVRLKRVKFWPSQTTASTAFAIDLVYITSAVTPATGNPVITPRAANQANTAEATVLALPTTQGTESGIIVSAPLVLGITGANSVINPPPGMAELVLWPPAGGNLEMDDPLMRAGPDEKQHSLHQIGIQTHQIGS
jgi:hypothetical protein